MTDPRLSAIESRAKALGWGWYTQCEYSDFTLDTDDFHLDFMETDEGLTAAERLLSLWEDGPECEVSRDELMGAFCIVEKTFPDDLIPGKYKLVRWSDE